MNPKIRQLHARKLVGMHGTQTMDAYDVSTLWRRFMPRRKEIRHVVTSDLYSLSVYPPDFFIQFNPSTPFEKWAALEVLLYEELPEGMEVLTLPDGLYAVFQHKGDAAAFYALHQYIYTQWLPGSAYVLDDRPHFELLGAGYRHNDPDSEEEVWVPVKRK